MRIRKAIEALRFARAFGMGGSVGSVTFNLRFPEQYYKAATKQFYNLNRYYNPELGRYMEPDPIGLEGGLNPYIYAGANPVMNVDPSGLFTLGYQFPSMPEPLYNFSMGLANGISFGLAQPVLNLFYGYNTANTGSTAYNFGSYAAILTLGGIAKGLEQNIVKNVAKYDVGAFDILKKGSKMGDGIDIHHAVQKNPAKQIINKALD